MQPRVSVSKTRQVAGMAILVLASLSGCGGDSRTPQQEAIPSQSSQDAPAEVIAVPISAQPGPQAATSDTEPKISGFRSGVSPFIAFVDMEVPGLSQVDAVGFRIEPRPGTLSLPVDVDYTDDYLERRGFSDNAIKLSVPVFGLYADYVNEVEIELVNEDGSRRVLQTKIETPSYVDPNGIFDRPRIVVPRAAGASLGFDFIYLKSLVSSPVIVDTDGYLRWVVPGVVSSLSSIFEGSGFVVGASESLAIQRVELDGTIEQRTLDAPGSTNFHHDILPGKAGLLAELDGMSNGTAIIESQLVEMSANGTVLHRWDLADSVSRRMQSQGDDPAQFVRLGIDWFHMNSAIYDPSDDSLIVSGREVFVAKIDYSTGDLKWILGDPSKYWHGFASLASLNLSLAPGGLWPVGQHALSITSDGLLMLFNNGRASNNQPAGTPIGEDRSYSAVSVYRIDAATRQATEVNRWVHPDSVLSPYCSSVQQTTPEGAMLVTYSNADNSTALRLVGVGSDHSVALDLIYPAEGCNSAWNARPIALNGLRIE